MKKVKLTTKVSNKFTGKIRDFELEGYKHSEFFAVHHALENDDDDNPILSPSEGWRVLHVPTGYAFPCYPPRRKDAVAIADKMLEMRDKVNWATADKSYFECLDRETCADIMSTCNETVQTALDEIRAKKRESKAKSKAKHGKPKEDIPNPNDVRKGDEVRLLDGTIVVCMDNKKGIIRGVNHPDSTFDKRDMYVFEWTSFRKNGTWYPLKLTSSQEARRKAINRVMV